MHYCRSGRYHNGGGGELGCLSGIIFEEELKGSVSMNSGERLEEV